MTTRRIPLALAISVFLLTGPAARASEVRSKIVTLAKEIQRLLGDEKQTEIAIGEFTGPPAPTTSAGPMIQAALIEELGKLKVGVNENAFVFIHGNYFVLEEESRKDALTIRLQVRIQNKSGKSIDNPVIDIGYRGNDDLVKLLAINTDLSDHTKADREGQNQKLKRDLQNPPLFLDGAKIRTSAGSPFAVEVLSRKAGSGKNPLKLLSPVEKKKGQALVEVKRGEEYVLRLHNSSRHEAAVSITIDGVDVFQFFEPATERPATFLIAPGTTSEIQGWMRNTEGKNAFLVGSFADSAAAKALKGSASVGTITVCFHPAWEGKTPPEYEGSRSANPDATNLGRDIKEKSVVVRRTIGPLLAAVSIRYSK